MKTAIYIENGTWQLVLTPETTFDVQALDQLSEEGHDLQISRGSFYRCQGGYHRQGADDESVILTKKPKVVPHEA